MESRLSQIIGSFQKNLDKVETLLTFDKVLQEICLKGLQKAKKGLDSFGNQNERFSVDSTITMIERIHDNDSMKPSYEIMHNQCIVLMVSYLSSVLEDIFKVAFSAKLYSGNSADLESEELKITIGEVLYDDLENIFLQKKPEINFQNMKSTLWSFERYIDIQAIERSTVIDNIILAQAMRHCIVHNGCIISEKTIGQLHRADKRKIKPNVVKDDYVQFSENEVHQIMGDMLSFTILLSKHVLEACPKGS